MITEFITDLSIRLAISYHYSDEIVVSYNFPSRNNLLPCTLSTHMDQFYRRWNIFHQRLVKSLVLVIAIGAEMKWCERLRAVIISARLKYPLNSDMHEYESPMWPYLYRRDLYIGLLMPEVHEFDDLVCIVVNCQRCT